MNNLLSYLFLGMLFCYLIAGFFHPITSFTQDLGRHIQTGQIILQRMSVPKTNLFSYTYPDFPFVNHHWFSEVIFYSISHKLGLDWLLILSTLTIATAWGLLVFSVRSKIHIVSLTIVSLVYFRVLFERTDVRPEIFSFFFVSLFLVILYKYRETFTRWIFLLPFLELIWVNTHIYFFIGLIIVLLFLLENLFLHRKHLVNRSTKILLFVFIASIFATLLNPNGITGAIYPLRVFTNYGYQIEENQNILLLWQLFQKQTIPYFICSVFLLFLSLFATIKKTKLIDWLLAITFSLIGIVAIRNFPLFVFATFIPAVTSFSLLYRRLIANRPLLASPLVAGILFCITAWQIQTITQIKGFGLGIAPGAENAADFFIEQNIQGPIFNNFDIGSYLDYRFYEKEKVFIDSRPEAYPATFFQNIYIPLQQNPHLFNTYAKKYQFNAIFFAHTDQTPWAETFLRMILTHKDWKPIYLDDTVIILVKNTTKNEILIKQFGMTPQTLQAKNIQTDNLTSLLRLASFFNKVELLTQEKNIYQAILTIDPTYCPVLRNFTIRLIQENNPAAGIYQQRFTRHCQ